MASPLSKKRSSFRLDAICEKLKSRSGDVTEELIADPESDLDSYSDEISGNHDVTMATNNSSTSETAMVTSQDTSKLKDGRSHKLTEIDYNGSNCVAMEFAEYNDARSSGSDTSSLKSVSSITGNHGNMEGDSHRSCDGDNSDISNQFLEGGTDESCSNNPLDAGTDNNYTNNALGTDDSYSNDVSHTGFDDSFGIQESVLDLSMNVDRSRSSTPLSCASNDLDNTQDSAVDYDPMIIQEYADSSIYDNDLLEETLSKSVNIEESVTQDSEESMNDDMDSVQDLSIDCRDISATNESQDYKQDEMTANDSADYIENGIEEEGDSMECIDMTTKENIEPGPLYDASEVRDYAADTMKELMEMYGYEPDESDIKERLPVDKFSFTNILKLNDDMVTRKILPSGATLVSVVDPSGKPVGYSKYDYYIRKLEAGESISKDILSRTGNSKYDHLMKKLEQNPLASHAGSITVKELINRNLQAKKQTSDTVVEPSGVIDVGVVKKSARPSKYDLINIERLKDRIKVEAAAAASGSLEGGQAAERIVVSAPTNSSISSADYIKACFSEKKSASASSSNRADVNQILQANEMNIYMKYIAKFSASVHCGHMHCVYQYKEHYHCLDEECNYVRFTRKEDVIRHYNWHKRRDNSLQHGFMRFSPTDDCNVYYSGCTLNKRHTHYHCMQVGCNKVYTSTSDIITHENFHKKNAALISDGFQRFRATEDCGTLTCSFYGQKTTHFHCRRGGCDFSFKNKCDIEKHKVYHVRDDQYNKEGFKKFSKHEICKYEGCRYSKNTNHFHCIRPGCDFAFTAANQISSHKRKHERRMRLIQFEQAKKRKRSGGEVATMSTEPVEEENSDLIDYHDFKKIKVEASETAVAVAQKEKSQSIPQSPTTSSHEAEPNKEQSLVTSVGETSKDSTLPAGFAKLSAVINDTGSTKDGENLSDSLNLPTPDTISPPVQGMSTTPTPTQTPTPTPTPAATDTATDTATAAAAAATANPAAPATTPQMASPKLSTSILTSTSTSTSTSSGKPPIILRIKAPECWQKYIKRYTANDHCESRCMMLYKDHYHCQVSDCRELFKSKDGVNKHARYHQLSDEAAEFGFKYFQYGQSCQRYYYNCMNHPQQHYHCVWSVREGDYCGHVLNTFNAHYMKIHLLKHKNSPDIVKIDDDDSKSQPSISSSFYTSGKNHSSPPQRYKHGVNYGYVLYKANRCPISDCHLKNRAHFHCTKTDCRYTTTSAAKMNEHKWNENAAYDGYKQLSRKVDCKRTGCKYNLIKKHFHCIRPGCKFSFTLQSQMETHARKHLRRIYGKNFEKQPQAMATLATATQVDKSGLVEDLSVDLSTAEINGTEDNVDIKPALTFVASPAPVLPSPKQGTSNILPKPISLVTTPKSTTFPANQSMSTTVLANQTTPALIQIATNTVSSTSVTAVNAIPSSSTPSVATSQPLPPFTIPLPPLDDDDSMPLQLTTNSKTYNTNTNNNTIVVNSGSGFPSNAIISAAGLPSNAVVLKPASAAAVSSVTGTLVYVSPVPMQSTQLVVVQAPAQDLSKSPQVQNLSVTTPPKLTSPESVRSHKKRHMDDKAVLDRFLRYDRHEDCHDRTCQFSRSSTHYHCTHDKCGYRFAGRTQMFKHAQHHDRVDSLVLDDFQRIKSSVHCERDECQFAQKNTHFHCLKCHFVCTDSSKVTAHRKYHDKLDAVAAAGFRQHSSTDSCGIKDCKYDKKYSHLHCTHTGCTHAVVGMSQMDAHSRKHKSDK
ncbi:zinc finger protein castor homolog 1-like [Glandiceps talaboti]